ncbi:MAG: hypothetical protein J0I77_01105 [Rudaea sp.]|uniref:molybdopterin-binding protein n=1 Tax=unclassified Rudaea TaxID=2627037 RepID=UPI0010F983A4|nr:MULTISPECIES: molybdopterin-binding protein [unclassified Rudaea]MBN8884290.1 hypothetical protein [Rudaea sp.]MBR0345297.1 hypothetical protein [Rudaea sp.]
MKPYRLCFAALAAVASCAYADTPAPQTAVAVGGENGKTLSLDFAALDKLPQRRVQAEAHGHKADCRGANLIDVLAQVGASSGEKLRGKDLALYVRIRAADGYRVVYALAELDPMFRGDNVPVLTHECDGKPLDANDGPFRIVAPDEKRPARWIRQVTAVDLLRAP